MNIKDKSDVELMLEIIDRVKNTLAVAADNRGVDVIDWAIKFSAAMFDCTESRIAKHKDLCLGIKAIFKS